MGTNQRDDEDEDEHDERRRPNAVHARDIAERPAEPPRLRVATVRPGRGDQRAEHSTQIVEHVDPRATMLDLGAGPPGAVRPPVRSRLCISERDADERDREQEVAR